MNESKKSLWLLWSLAQSEDESTVLLGIYDGEAAAKAAYAHAGKITIERPDGSTFRPYDDPFRLHIEQRCDINAMPSYDVSRGFKIVEPEKFTRTVHGPQEEHEYLMDCVLNRVEMDLYGRQ